MCCTGVFSLSLIFSSTNVMDMNLGAISREATEDVLDLGELVDFVWPVHAKSECLVGILIHEKPGNVRLRR